MSYTSLADIPTAERNMYDQLRDQLEKLSGYTLNLPDWALVSFANQNEGMTNLTDFAAIAWREGVIPQDMQQHMPWLQFGLDHGDYQSLGTTFATEYRKLTGQDISAEDLNKAFQSSQRGAGGLLTGSEYAQQLLSDTTLQQTYGWLKYGMDFQQFQQQKLQMRQSFGRDLTDEEATSQLQYLHTASGGNAAVHAQPSQKGAQQRQGSEQSTSVIR